MEKLDSTWIGVNEIYVYGMGNIGKKCIDKLLCDLIILGIIDNDEQKWGTYHGIPVKGLVGISDHLKKHKTVIMTGGRVYAEVKRVLQEIGLEEYKEFCSIERFISEWYWKERQQNCLLEVHTAITMQCTFRCKSCNMFVPYYSEKMQYKLEELKQDYDILFSFVDYLFSIELLGGEPFLYKDLGEFIQYLYDRYHNKIGAIALITNGSIVPEKEVLDILKRCGVVTYISDYSESIPYKEKINELIRTYKKEDLPYVVQSSMRWKDFGFPNAKAIYEAKSPREHMLTCGPLFHGLNDKKLYYCHVAWSAEKAGLYQLDESDYVDLNALDCTRIADKRKLVLHSMGEEMRNGHVSLCQICGGCGDDNPVTIKAGEQLPQ